MKIDPTATWGYPVLRSSVDDYVKSEIQSSLQLELADDFASILLNYQIQISVPEILELIKNKKARVIIYVHCRETWFGKMFDASNFNGQLVLDKSLIEGQTEFLTLVIATEKVSDFYSTKFHPEYQEAKFNIEEDQILAIADPESLYISRDLLKNVSSLFDYAVNHNLSEGEWRVKLTENRLVIEANANQVKYLRNGENTNQGKAVLLNSIFLPALTQIIAHLSNNPDEYSDLAWAMIVKAKIDLVIKTNLDSLGLAHELLRMPTTWLNKNMKWIDDEN
jgi:hypothetical protein